MTKICSMCKEKKDINEFGIHRRNKDGIRHECKSCRKIESKKYYIKNKEKIKNYNLLYREKNLDEIKKRKKKYRDDNKKKVSFLKKQYYEKNKNNPEFFLRLLISCVVRNAIKKQKSFKYGISIFQYLPYTIQELKEHLEKQFEPWMNWENHGKYDLNKKTWQIDHIIPQSKLPYSSMEHPNFQKCWVLENLRPLETMENLKKGIRSEY